MWCVCEWGRGSYDFFRRVVVGAQDDVALLRCCLCGCRGSSFPTVCIVLLESVWEFYEGRVNGAVLQGVKNGEVGVSDVDVVVVRGVVRDEGGRSVVECYVVDVNVVAVSVTGKKVVVVVVMWSGCAESVDGAVDAVVTVVYHEPAL